MLGFARSQQEQAEQKRRLEETIRAARELLENGEFKQAVSDIEKALLLHPDHAELQKLQKTAQAKFREQDERQKKEFIEKQLRAMKVALEHEDYTGAIDLGRKTMVLAGENKDVTRMLQLAERERELRDRNKEAAEQFKTAIFRMDEGKFDEAEKILEDVQKTHIFDPRVHKLLETAREKKPLPPGDETRIGIFGPGGEVITPPGAAVKAPEREYVYVVPKAPEAATAPTADRTMIGTPQQIAEALSQPQIVEPPAAAPPPPPPPAAMPPVVEPPVAPPVEKEKKKKVKEKGPVAAPPAPAAPPVKPVEKKPAEPVPVKAAPPAAPEPVKAAPAAPVVEKAPPAVEKAPPVVKPKPPEEKKPAAAKPAGAYEETVPVFKPKKEKPVAVPAAAAAAGVAIPAEIPVWKKPAVMGGIAAVVVLAVVIGVVMTRKTGTEQPGTGGTGTEVTQPQPGPTAPAGPTPAQVQETMMDEARTLMASKKYDAAGEKLQQAKNISGGTHGSDIDALMKRIEDLKGNKALQDLLAREEKLWQSGVQAYDQNRIGEAKKAFDEISKMQGGQRRSSAQDYLGKKIPDLEKANGWMSEAQQLAQKKDKGSLEQAKSRLEQVIGMNGPRTTDARNLEGTVQRSLNALAGAEAAAATEAKINELKSGAAQDIGREDFAGARAKADQIRSLGSDPATVLNAVDRAEQGKASSLQSQFNNAKNDANALKQLQSELQKYSGMSGRVGEAARDIAGKIPGELTRLEAASRPAPSTPTPSTPSAPARSASIRLLALSPQKWTGPTPSAGQQVNSRFLDAELKAQSANVPNEIVQRATPGSSLQLLLNISDSGKVTGGQAQSGDATIGQGVIDTAKTNWVFGPPPRVNGKPVTTTVVVKVQF
jgi:tetratricopeptide (TPR) repeat protein